MSTVELHKLNGDTSWLLRLPTSSSSKDTRFYNLVLDPWLDPTPQVDGSPLFSRQTRIEPAAFASIAELDSWLQQSQGGQLDAMLFSHPFTDHLHPETVAADAVSIAVLQRVTVFTTADSLAALRSLGVALDSAKIVNLSSLAARQDVDQVGKMPAGTSITHLRARDWSLSPAWPKLHSAILVSAPTTAGRVHIVYSPHGITPHSLPEILKQYPAENEKREFSSTASTAKRCP